MEPLSAYIYLIFGLAIFFTFAIFYKASQNSKIFLFISLLWIGVLSFLSLSGRYTFTRSLLPIFPLVTIPPVLLVILLFVTQRGKEFIKRLDRKTLMILHFVRILVESVLFWLAVYQLIPESLTFEGRNFDILIGLSAPAIYYFGFVKTKLSKSAILVWNVIGLASLINVIGNTVYTVLILKQANFALGYFPFVLLPAFIVPLIMLAHLASIKQIPSNKQ